jgi:hypothetical protein
MILIAENPELAQVARRDYSVVNPQTGLPMRRESPVNRPGDLNTRRFSGRQRRLRKQDLASGAI